MAFFIGMADLTPNWEFESSPTITGFPYSSGDLSVPRR